MATFVTNLDCRYGKSVELAAHNCGSNQLNVSIELKMSGSTVDSFREYYTANTQYNFGERVYASDAVGLYANGVKTHIEKCEFLSITEKVILWDRFKREHTNGIIEAMRQQLGAWSFQYDIDVEQLVREKIAKEEECLASDSDDSDEDDDDSDESEEEVKFDSGEKDIEEK